MSVIITCKICKRQQVTSSSLLSDVCEQCVHAANEMQKSTWQARYGAGDAVAKVTKAIGIPECGGCGRRRRAMNTVDLNKGAAEVLTGLMEAVLNPQKVLEQNGIQETIDRAEARRAPSGKGESRD